MSDYSGAWQIGGAILGGILGHRRDKTPSYHPKDIAVKPLSEYNPNIDSLMGSQTDVALQMMSGELPDSVKQQIEDFSAERAMQNGIGWSTERVQNLTARDLGLASLDLINQGMTYANQLNSIAVDAQTRDINAQISDANMAFDAWKSQTEIAASRSRDNAANLTNMLQQATAGVSSYYQTKRNDQRWNDTMDFYKSVYTPPKSGGKKKTYTPPPPISFYDKGFGNPTD